MAKERNIALVYLFGFLTFGIYFIYWYIKTKDDMNEMGANVPTGILLFIPLVNYYWIYKYAEAYATVLKKDNNTILWAVLFLLVGIITPFLVQSELNKLAGGMQGGINPAAQPAQQMAQPAQPEQPVQPAQGQPPQQPQV
jgi:hypothetical protein